MCVSGKDGKPAETVEEMFWRVAFNVAKVEELWNGDVSAGMPKSTTFSSLARSSFPNSPTFTGAGTPLGQLARVLRLAYHRRYGP